MSWQTVQLLANGSTAHNRRIQIFTAKSTETTDPEDFGIGEGNIQDPSRGLRHVALSPMASGHCISNACLETFFSQ
jgi:hypothetical protein